MEPLDSHRDADDNQLSSTSVFIEAIFGQLILQKIRDQRAISSARQRIP